MVRRRMFTEEDMLHIALLNYARSIGLFVIHQQNEGRRTRSEAIYHKKMGGIRGASDLIILNARCGYDSLFMELKTSKDKVFKKDEKLKKSDTLTHQMNFIKKGYKHNIIGCFCWSFDMGKEILDAYKNNDKSHLEKVAQVNIYG